MTERTCWNCEESRLCFLKRRLDELISTGINMLNIDGDVAPGRCHHDLFIALARSCMLYKESEVSGD